MTRLRPQSVGKAESLFVANLKPFSTASVNRRLPMDEHSSPPEEIPKALALGVRGPFSASPKGKPRPHMTSRTITSPLVDLRRKESRLGAALQLQLLQYRRHMQLDGVG